MNKIFKTAILGIAMMLSVNFAFAQNQDTYNGSDPEYDDMYITFINMGNLPNSGSITIGWHHGTNIYHPNPWWNTKSFLYPGVGDHYFDDYGNWNPRDWIGFKVTVVLGSAGGEYIATKSWDGNYNHVTFTQDDFHSLLEAEDHSVNEVGGKH